MRSVLKVRDKGVTGGFHIGDGSRLFLGRLVWRGRVRGAGGGALRLGGDSLYRSEKY